MQSINTLYEFAIPTKGSFKDVIGEVVFGDYKTLVMTATRTTTIGENIYNTVEGYILVKPLADQFKKIRSDQKMKSVRKWEESNKKFISRCQDVSTERPLSIAIEGSKEIQGTYFRPDIVLEVLEWVCPAFKTEINAVYENYVSENNMSRQAVHIANEYHSELTSVNLAQFEEEKEEEEEFSDSQSASERKKEIEKQMTANKQRLNEISQRINQLFNARKTKLIKEEQIALVKEQAALNEKQEILERQLRQVSDRFLALKQEESTKKKSYLYNIKCCSDIVYKGLSQTQPIGNKSAVEVRFDQHISKALKVAQSDDFMHVFMAGKIVEYCSLNGIQKQDITPEVFKEIFSVEQMTEILGTKEDIELLETQAIQQHVASNPGKLFLNMKKNPTQTKRTKSTISDAPDAQPSNIPAPEEKPKQVCPYCNEGFKRLATHKCKLAPKQ